MTNVTGSAARHAAPPPDSEPPNDVEGLETSDTDRSRKRKLIVLLLVFAMILLVGGIFGWYLFNKKPLSQLPGIPSSSAPHYLFSMYGVTRPLGVAVNAAGDRIYVTQSDGPRVVQIFDGSGHPLGTLEPPAKSGASHVPVYVAVNPVTEEVYVSDRLSNAIYVYDSAGSYQRQVQPGKEQARSWAPLGLAFASDGSLYVSDVGTTQRILVFAPDGTFSHAFGDKDGLSFANGLAIDGRGNIAVADSNNGRLLIYGASETSLATVSPGTGEASLGLPRGVATGDGERLYVVDTTDHMVRVFEMSGEEGATPTYVASFGGEGSSDGAFEYPNGIAVDSHARVYVTDRENMRVQVWGY